MCTANWFALSRQPSCKAILRDVAGRPLTAGSPVDKTAGRSDRTVEGVKPEMPRGAPNGETHRYSASDPQATGHPGAIREDLRVIQVTRRFGAPFPSLGEGKQKGLRANPRARIKTGANQARLFDKLNRSGVPRPIACRQLGQDAPATADGR